MTRLKKNHKSAKDYENLGRAMASIYESGYLDKTQTLKNSFLKGVMGGIGGVVGATLIIGLLVWVLTLFGQIPLIGHFVESLRHTLENR